MRARALKIAKGTVLLVGVVAITLLAVRIWETQRGPELEVWHTHAPQEMSAEELDAADWNRYLAAEQAVFDDVRSEVTAKLDPEDRVPINRYFEGSPVYPGRFARDWNRSYVMEPQGAPVGAAVLLHGLTDAPYSQRHIAARYAAHGFVAIVPRLPGHGTVPAGLAEVDWKDWMAATRLAVREARARIGPDLPLHMVGFSNGGALATKYALDAIEDPALSPPDRLVLISPNIGITAFARFAGFAGLPAFLPHFAKAAWLSILPEFNPFKYNSFPVNGARQTWRMTQALQEQILRLARNDRLAGLPPVLTFQSVIDFTVSTRAIIASLYALLPANGSELVLFDMNRSAKLGPLLSSAADVVLTRVLPPPPRPFRTVIISNASHGDEVVERVVEAGATAEQVRPLGLVYPLGVFSLSHVALPFPPSDGLYGSNPDPHEDFGITLGTIAARGERGALIVSLDSLLRMSSNPFFSYMIGRIEEDLGPGAPDRRDARPAMTAEAYYRADNIWGLYRVIWRVTGGQQILLIGLAVVVAALAAAPLKFQQLVINSLVEGGTISRVAWLCAGFLAVTLLSAALKFALNYRLSVVGELIVRRIRERLYGNYVTDIATAAPDAPKRGTLVTMLAAEAESVGAFAGAALASPLVQFGTLVSVIAFILASQPLLGVLALCVVAPQAAIVLAMQQRINRRVRERVQALRDASDRISESDLERVEDEIVADFRDVFETRRKLFLLKLSSKFALSALSVTGAVGVLFLGGWLVLNDRSDVGTVVASLTGLTRIEGPWRELVSFFRNASTVRVKYAMLARSIMPRPADVT